MKLNYIELFGFKSFADRTRLNININISAIVGPNGSGKSNIADAVKWVLGEQSAKSLRGSKMEDVIFSGTEDKKPMNMAEVSLSLDNSDHTIDLPYEEIVITRRGYRSGESEYLLNKSNVRLKDIRTLLMDTGIGKEGYSIIGQGRIDSILSGSSEERRQVFEEASGISKYKYQKIDAEKKLVKNEESLSELESTNKIKSNELKLLERQASNAKKALMLIKRMEFLELSQLKVDLEKNKEDLFDIKNKIKGLEENLIDNNDSFLKLNKKLAPYQKSISKIEENINENISAVENNKEKINKDSLNIELLNSKNDFINKDINRLEENIKLRENKNKDILEKLKKYEDELNGLKNEKNNILKEIEEKNNDLNSLENKINSNNREFSQLKEKRNHLKHEYDRLNIQYSTQIELRKNFSEMEKKSLEEREKLLKRIKDKEEESKELLTLINDNELDLDNKNKKLLEVETNLEKGRDYLNKEKIKLNDLNRKLYEVKSDRKVRENIYNNFEGYYKPVQQLLKVGSRDKEINERIKGVLADLIQVDEKYQKAIDVALGSSLQNIVVENEEDGKYLINYLKKNNLGRITFLPISKIKGKNKTKVQGKAIKNACDVITYPKELDGIIKQFLSNTLIVKNLDDAVETSNVVRNARIISLDGDVINSWGSMVGGNINRRGSTLLNRKKELEDLIENEKHLEDLSLKVNETIKKYEDRICELEENINVESESIKNISMEINDDKNKYQKIIYEIDALKERLSEDDGNIKFSNENFIEIKNDLMKLQEKYDEINISYSNKLEDIDRDTKESIVLEKEILEEKNKKEIVIRDINLLENNIIGLEDNLSMNKSDSNNDSRVLINLRNDLDSNIKKIDKYENNLEIIKEDVEKKEEELKILRNKLLKEKEKLGDDQINLEELKDNINKLKNDIYKFNLNFENKKEKRRSLIENYVSQNDLDNKDLIIKLRSLVDIEINKKEVLDIKSQLSKIGYFDISSIDSYEILNEEVEKLRSQINDLKDTRNDIKKMIKDLEEKIRVIFTKSFKEINTRFSKIFKILFDGGNAEVIIDGSDVLEAEIEIIAQPPGKRLTSLALLSGGEKALTAIALLFAIFEIRPAPFCILDEIDSALDESNISRYKRYLKSLTDKTQFIIITHRKNTMEVADVLYGVTMQEKGVSTVLVLDLEDYEEEENV